VSASEPVSPCIAVCALDPATGFCRGCFRTAAEIGAWVSLDAMAKRHILDLVERRRQQASRPPASPD
jgi:predicted Fe-S protein YdhL (DUF1289 family)